MPDLSITVFFIPANYTHTPPQPHSHQLIARIGWRKLASEPRATFFGCGHPRLLINSNSLQFPLWSQTNTHYPVVTQPVTLYEKRKKFSKKEKKKIQNQPATQMFPEPRLFASSLNWIGLVPALTFHTTRGQSCPQKSRFAYLSPVSKTCYLL